MRDRTMKRIVTQQFASDAARKYKYQPTGPAVIKTEGDQKSWDNLNNHPLKDSHVLAGVSTSPAAIGQGGTTLTIPNDFLRSNSQNPLGDTKPLAQADEAEVFGPPTPENKHWVLQSLGFVPHGKNIWFHPGIGVCGVAGRYYDFNLDTDELSSIVPELYRKGLDEARFNLQQQFKSFIGI